MSHENKITRELLDAVRAILVTAALVVIFALSLILIASGMGYLLTLILPFTLFQSTQLSAIMALFVLFLIHVFKKGMSERVSEAMFYQKRGWMPVFVKSKQRSSGGEERNHRSMMFLINNLILMRRNLL